MKNYNVWMREEKGKIISVVVSGWNRGDAGQNAKKMYPTFSLTGRIEEFS